MVVKHRYFLYGVSLPLSLIDNYVKNTDSRKGIINKKNGLTIISPVHNPKEICVIGFILLSINAYHNVNIEDMFHHNIIHTLKDSKKPPLQPLVDILEKFGVSELKDKINIHVIDK